MEYRDIVYGKVEIIEPVVLELLSSAVFERLKGIDQAGYFEPYFPGSSHTRFEHSVGVYLLLKRYGTSLEEQIAGLIHDVSHSAFSHCIDYVLSEGSPEEHSHQDNVFDEYVRRSEIPTILQKHNLDVDYILDDRNFPLKEKNIPDLCADRIDYSLRGLIHFKTPYAKKVPMYLEKLKVVDNNWIFEDYESAFDFAESFKHLNDKYYSGLETAVMFRTAGDTLKYSLDRGYITLEDLYTTDNMVLEKIKKMMGADEKLSSLFERMDSGKGYSNNPNDFDVIVYNKSRIVDPLCYHEREVKRVSDINPGWKKVIAEEMKPKKYFVKFSKL